MTECRYIVARLVPDPIREEPVNIGVVLQSDDFVACRFARRLPKAHREHDAFVADLIRDLGDHWDQLLRKGTEWVGFPGMGGTEAISQTDPRYLHWLRDTHRQHLRFSDIRRAEAEIRDQFGFESLLLRLYDTFVGARPQPKRVVAPRRSRLHAALRRDFRPLLDTNKLVDGGLVEGTILWQVDFAHRRNGTEIAIAAIDFDFANVFQRAEHIFAAWADLNDCKGADVSRYSVVQNYRPTSELRKARTLVERFASGVFEYEGQRQPMLEEVYYGVGEHDALRSVQDEGAG